MVSSIVLPPALSARLSPRRAYELWTMKWAHASCSWRPLGYIWWAKAAQRWATTLQAESGYFSVRCLDTHVAIMYVEERVVLRLDFDTA